MKRKIATNVFAQIYNETFNEAYGYILAITGDAKAAPKILKECYLALFEFIKKSKSKPDSLRNVLFSIIHDKLQQYNETNSQTDIPKPTRIKKYNHLISELLQTEFDRPKNQQELLELLDTTLTLVSNKETIQKRAFLLYYLYDFPIERVAKEIGVTEMFAGNYIFEITQEIRDALQAENFNK